MTTPLYEFSVTYQVRDGALGELHTSRRVSNSDFISYPDVTLIVTRKNGSCLYVRTPPASWLGALSPLTLHQYHIRHSTPEISPRGKQGDLCIWNMWNVMSISEMYVIVWSWCVVLRVEGVALSCVNKFAASGGFCFMFHWINVLRVSVPVHGIHMSAE